MFSKQITSRWSESPDFYPMIGMESHGEKVQLLETFPWASTEVGSWRHSYAIGVDVDLIDSHAISFPIKTEFWIFYSYKYTCRCFWKKKLICE